MPRPFNRRQSVQNAAFLAALARTGNARLAARMLGVHRSTYTKRRAGSAAFAAAWDAALARADARLRAESARREARVVRGGHGAAPEGQGPAPFRTRGSELHVARTASGRLQRRRAPAGRVTEAALAHVLDVLAETNNLRFAAAAAGIAHPTLLARAARSPVFAALLGTAKAVGDARIRHDESEGAGRARARPVACPQPGGRWPAGMTLHDAMLVLQQRRAAAEGRPPGPRRRPARVRAIEAITGEQLLAAVAAAIARAARRRRFESAGTWRLAEEPPPPYAAAGPDAASPPPPDANARPARRRRP